MFLRLKPANGEYVKRTNSLQLGNKMLGLLLTLPFVHISFLCFSFLKCIFCLMSIVCPLFQFQIYDAHVAALYNICFF
jgi:hypothetical protein